MKLNIKNFDNWKSVYIISSCLLLSIASCTNFIDNPVLVEENAINDNEPAFEPAAMEAYGLSPDMMVLFYSLFSEENADKVITSRYDLDEVTGEYIVTSRFENQYEILKELPRLKSRSEADDNNWIYWGDICGLSSGAKFAKFLEEHFKGVLYETRFEPISGSNCRKAYYRKG